MKKRKNAIAKIEKKEITQPGDAASILAVISHAAKDPKTNVEKLERLTSLYERITAQQSKFDFDAAMALAQSEMCPVAADATNPQTRSKYASYFALDNALRPIYTKHGFSMTLDTEPAEGTYVTVVCEVSNRGHTKQYRVKMPTDGKGAKGNAVMTETHAIGAGITYGQRYLLKMVFNIAVGGDDDGNYNSDKQGKLIDEKQAANIRELLTTHGKLEANFLRWAKIERIEDLQAQFYDTAVAGIMAPKNES